MQSSETILIAKTLPELVDQARAALIAQHSYECPAILTVVAEAPPEFVAWATTALGASEKL